MHHYELIRPLGQGQMGTVYLAHDHKLERDVALKIINTNEVSISSVQQRLRREARALAALNHTNVVTVHSLEETDDTLCIIMEIIEGETLESTCRESNDLIAIDRFMSLASQIAGGLATAHESHILHRDIKPANLMVRPDGVLKIVDFGLAITPRDPRITQEGAIVGTPLYMAPELFDGAPATEESDVYSMGVVFYELLSGRRPWDGKEMEALLEQKRQGYDALLESIRGDIPLGITYLIYTCLSPVTADRNLTAREISQTLAQYISGDLGEPVFGSRDVSWFLSDPNARATPGIPPKRKRVRGFGPRLAGILQWLRVAPFQQRSQGLLVNELLSELMDVALDTRVYMRGIREDPNRRDARAEQSLAEAWRDMATAFLSLEDIAAYDFALRLFVKSQYWADPEVWQEDDQGACDIRLGQIIDDARILLSQVSRERTPTVRINAHWNNGRYVRGYVRRRVAAD